MIYHESEVPKELIVGSKYTGRELGIFMNEHQNIKIISKSCGQFSELVTTPLRVLEIIEGYVHYNSKGTYIIPSQITKIYIVE